MAFLQLLRQFKAHPLTREHRFSAWRRAFQWQLTSRLWRGKIEYPFVGGSRLLVNRGMVGATGNIYYGLHEYEDMSLVLHALREGDLFFDVGANVGAYTVLAAAVCGAHVIAFEPVPATFAHLLDNLRINNITDRVHALNSGVGSAQSTLRFTAALDAVNHVASAGDEASGGGQELVSVPVVPLDDFASTSQPAIIKIDVEGYETPVIEGAQAILVSPKLLAVIMELNGSGTRYGFDEHKLHQRMLDRGFRWCTYAPERRELLDSPPGTPFGLNTLYVRDFAALSARVKSAASFRVLGRDI